MGLKSNLNAARMPENPCCKSYPTFNEYIRLLALIKANK